MFIIPSIDLSMKLSLSEVFVSNIIVTMVISNKSCCKHVLFTNLSDFISTTTRVTSLKSKKFLFCSFSVAKFGIAPASLMCIWFVLSNAMFIAVIMWNGNKVSGRAHQADLTVLTAHHGVFLELHSKGLASYCKAETTFTFHFSIINA